MSRNEASITVIRLDENDEASPPEVFVGTKAKIAQLYREYVGDSIDGMSADGLTNVELAGITIDEIDWIDPGTHIYFQFTDPDWDKLIERLKDRGQLLVSVDKWTLGASSGWKIRSRSIPGRS